LGIAEYWIIDRFRRQATLWRRAGDAYAATTIDENDGVLSSPLLPGLELPLAELLAEADRLKDAEE